jgi:MarR family transcriptional regulator for hemolysin
MPPPALPPIGLKLARTAKAVSGAFDDALAAAGGSLPIWLILISLKTQRLGNQRELAEAVGIQGATLTHHLNAMESAGLVTRRRDDANRRVHVVELTAEGEAMFHRLRTAAVTFDQRLRAGITAGEIAVLEQLLDRLHHNVSAGASR